MGSLVFQEGECKEMPRETILRHQKYAQLHQRVFYCRGGTRVFQLAKCPESNRSNRHWRWMETRMWSRSEGPGVVLEHCIGGRMHGDAS